MRRMLHKDKLFSKRDSVDETDMYCSFHSMQAHQTNNFAFQLAYNTTKTY